MTTSRQTPRMLPTDDLLDNDQNVRNHVGDIDELAASIRQHGLVQPIVVTGHRTQTGRWLILAGHRRVAAARAIDLTQVPCIVRHDAGTADDQVALMLVENMQRSNLTAVEKARAIAKLITRGMTQTDVARRLGTTPTSVNNYIMLLDLPEDELAQIEAGEVNLGDARTAIKKVRSMRRHNAGHPDRGRPVHVEPGHFTSKHPLAQTVALACDHTSRPKVGGVGCGQCFEEAIRADERAVVEDALSSAQVAS